MTDLEKEKSLIALIKTRRTIRKFKDKPLSREIVEELIRTAAEAPSACNLQAWDFVVVESGELKEKLAEAGVTYQVKKAPVSVFVCYDAELSRANFANIQSAAAAIQNLILTAHSLGLGALWATTLGNKEKVRATLNIPQEKELVAVVVLGQPDENPIPPKRKPIEEILHWNQFDKNRFAPTSQNPDDWTLEQIARFQGQKIRSGAKYNKLSSESAQLLNLLTRNIKKPISNWLDIFPCTGIYLKKLTEEYPETNFTFWELSDNTIEFIKNRLNKKIETFKYPNTDSGKYDVITMVYRIEGVPQKERKAIFEKIYNHLSRDGKFILVFTNKNSYFSIFAWLRNKIGRKNVENVLAPEVNLGPYKALDIKSIRSDLKKLGFRAEKERGLFFVPKSKEIFSKDYFKNRIFFKCLGYLLYFAIFVLSLPFRIFKNFYKTQVLVLNK